MSVTALVGVVVAIAGVSVTLATFWRKSSPKLVLEGIKESDNGWIGSIATIHGVSNKGEGRADEVALHAYLEYLPPTGSRAGRGFRCIEAEPNFADAISSGEVAIRDISLGAADEHFPAEVDGARPLWIVISCKGPFWMRWQFRYLGKAMRGGKLVERPHLVSTGLGIRRREERSHGRLFDMVISPTLFPPSLERKHAEALYAGREVTAYRLEREGFEDREPGFMLWFRDDGTALLFQSADREPITCASRDEAMRRQERYATNLPAPWWATRPKR